MSCCESELLNLKIETKKILVNVDRSLINTFELYMKDFVSSDDENVRFSKSRSINRSISNKTIIVYLSAVRLSSSSFEI